MMRAACVVLPLLLWACAPESLPEPSILSVEPAEVPVGFPSALSVRLNAALPLVVDYDDQAVDPSQLAVTVRLAGKVVDIPFAESDGTIIVPVPEGLEVGIYDIRVTLADGRETLRERAFAVVPMPTFTGGPGDGGPPEDGGPGRLEGITGFEISRIGDQVRNRPFKVTIHALGPEASTFQEPISLRASRGRVSSITLGSFRAGVREEEISLNNSGPRIYLLIEDARGHKGLSNSFQVRSH